MLPPLQVLRLYRSAGQHTLARSTLTSAQGLVNADANVLNAARDALFSIKCLYVGVLTTADHALISLECQLCHKTPGADRHFHTHMHTHTESNTLPEAVAQLSRWVLVIGVKRREKGVNVVNFHPQKLFCPPNPHRHHHQPSSSPFSFGNVAFLCVPSMSPPPHWSSHHHTAVK